MNQPLATPPVDAPAFETPWDRLVRGARALRVALLRLQLPPTASAGERHVHLGLRIAAASLVLTTAGSVATAYSFEIAGVGGAVGTLVASLLVWGGVLASSRLARTFMLLQAMGYAIGAVVVATSPYLSQTPRQLVGMGVLTLGLATYGVGTAIATLTPSALRWHQENVARRRAKRGGSTSLAEWRRAPVQGGDA
jgi:hypothetical protein